MAMNHRVAFEYKLFYKYKQFEARLHLNSILEIPHFSDILIVHP